MKTLVVDASVALKWLIPETGSPQARELLSESYRLIAPDLLWIEVAAVTWKAVRRGDLSAEEAEQMASDLSAYPVEIVESLPLLPDAVRFAVETDRTVYDSLYICLAAREKVRAVTADQRLVNALRSGPYADRVLALGELV